MFDMIKMFGKINEIKAEAEKVKEELKDIYLEAEDSQGIVKVKVSADKNMHEIHIDPSCLLPEKKDLVESATLEACQKAFKLAGDHAKELIKERINSKYPEIAGMGLDKWLG